MPKTLQSILAAAVIASAALLPVASAQTAGAQLYIANTSSVDSPVNIYVDGALFASNVFSGDTSIFARSITPGSHQVTVTRNYQAPGEDDVLNTSVSVPAGGSTLTLANDMNKVNGQLVQSGFELDLSNAPD